MMFLAVALLMVAAANAATISMNQHVPGTYNFHYAAGDAGGHTRSESGHGGSVSGSYSYIDPNGDHRQVNYVAGPNGFQPSGAIGVDRKTAEAAAAIAALAPKAPPAPHPVAPVAPISYFGLGGRVVPGPSGYVAVW